MDKTISGFRVRKNNKLVIHQNHWCFISNYTQRLFLVDEADCAQFISNPMLWIKQSVVLS